MEPWQSWTAIGLVAAGGYIYYSGTNPREIVRKFQTKGDAEALSGSRRQSVDKQSARRKERSAKSPQHLPVSSAEAVADASSKAAEAVGVKKRKGQLANGNTGSNPQQPREPNTSYDDPVEEEYGDRELARQLEARKKGVSLSRDSGLKRAGGKREKVESKGSRESGSTNGTGNNPASANNNKGAADVSDMLEPTTPGPSSLRITGAEKPKKKHDAPAVQAQETKKQRQNRRKVEEQKLQREEDEKRRQMQLEQQRRSAREARGEPPKNGIPAAMPQKSAWSAGAQAGGTAGTSDPAVAPLLANNPVHLLDTFDQDAASSTSSTEPRTNATRPATAASTSHGQQDLLSEDAQLATLTDENDWNEVSTKKKKAKAKASDSATTTTSETSAVEQINGSKVATARGAIPPKAQPSAPTLASKTNGYAALQTGSHPDDSDWAA